MRVAVALALLLLAVPAPATRAAAPDCPGPPTTEWPSEETLRFQELVAPFAHEARPALGSRFAGLWFRIDEPSWHVAVAPLDADLAAAREEVDRLIAAHFAPDDARHVSDRLGVVAMPYTSDELEAVQQALVDELTPWPRDLISIGSGSCGSDGVRRVEVSLHVEAPPETVARVEQAVARWGDRAVVVRVAYRAFATPGLMVTPPAPSYARVRCGRDGRLRVTPVGARRLVLRRNGRRVDVRGTTRVRLRGTVDVVAVLPDGRRVRERLRLPSCR